MPLDLPFILGILDARSSGMAVRLVSLLRLVRCLKVIQVVPIVMNILLTRLAVSNSNAELLKFGIIFVLLAAISLLHIQPKFSSAARDMACDTDKEAAPEINRQRSD